MLKKIELEVVDEKGLIRKLPSSKSAIDAAEKACIGLDWRTQLASTTTSVGAHNASNDKAVNASAVMANDVAPVRARAATPATAPVAQRAISVESAARERPGAFLGYRNDDDDEEEEEVEVSRSSVIISPCPLINYKS